MFRKRVYLRYKTITAIVDITARANVDIIGSNVSTELSLVLENEQVAQIEADSQKQKQV